MVKQSNHINIPIPPRYKPLAPDSQAAREMGLANVEFTADLAPLLAKDPLAAMGFSAERSAAPVQRYKGEIRPDAVVTLGNSGKSIAGEYFPGIESTQKSFVAEDVQRTRPDLTEDFVATTNLAHQKGLGNSTFLHEYRHRALRQLVDQGIPVDDILQEAGYAKGGEAGLWEEFVDELDADMKNSSGGSNRHRANRALDVLREFLPKNKFEVAEKEGALEALTRRLGF